MISLLLNPVVLTFLVWLVARRNADIDLAVMFFIALGVGLAGAAASMLVGGFLALLALPPVLGLLVYLLMKYCGVTLQQALIVTGLYFAYQLGFAVLYEFLVK